MNKVLLLGMILCSSVMSNIVIAEELGEMKTVPREMWEANPGREPKESKPPASDKLEAQKQRDLQAYYKQLQLNMASLEANKQLEQQKYYEQLQLNIEHSCGKLKNDKKKYQECIEKNYPSKNYGMHGGLGKASTGIGMYGGNGKNPLPNIGLGFCNPSTDQTECLAPDGRVYKLDNSINQLGRQILKDSAPIENHDERKPGAAVQK
jgi:hypothetical protein